MTIEQAKEKVRTDLQQYYRKEQVIELLNKLKTKQESNVLTLF